MALLLPISNESFAAEEGMTQMPKIKPKSIYSIQSNEKGEDLLDNRGFGDKEPMVRMMNLMMVESSGVEGMDMSDDSMKKPASHDMSHGDQMKVADNKEMLAQAKEKSTTQYEFEAIVVSPPAKVGANSITISIRDKKTKKSIKGLKPKIQVSMTSMDMGTDEPRVREISLGKYQFKATFSMRGPWAVKLLLPNGQGETIPFAVEANPNKP